MPTSSYANIAVTLASNSGKFKTEMDQAGNAVLDFGKATGRGMADVAHAMNVAATSADSFAQVANIATRGTIDVGNAVAGTIEKIQSAATALTHTMIGAGTAFFAASAIDVKAAASLETAINNVATVWDSAQQKVDHTTLSLSDASKQILDLSMTVPQTAKVLAEGLYLVASSGFQGSDAMKVLTASAKAASAGLTDTSTAVTAVAGVLNAYGMSANQATHISDVLFQAVNLGVFSFEQLAQTMGDFIGTAAIAKVSIEEAAAAMASITLAGVPAAEASTGLNRALQEFIKPGTDLSNLLQSMGYETGIVALQQRGLHGILSDITKVIGTNADEWTRLFPEMRAARAVLALIAGDGANYDRVFKSMTNETELYGATQKALDKQSQSLGFQLETLKNTVTKMAIEWGQTLMPAVKLAVELFADFLAGINAIPAPIVTFIEVVGAAAAALTLLGGLYLAHKVSGLIMKLTIEALTFALEKASIATAAASAGLVRFGISEGIMGTITTGLTWAVTGLTWAMRAMQTAMPILLIATTVLTVAMTLFGASQHDNKQKTEDLKQSLDQTTGAITDQTAALIRQQAIKDGSKKAADELGVSMNDLTAALLGQPEAIDRVTTARKAAVQVAYDNVLANKDDQEAARQAQDVLIKKQDASEKLGNTIKSTTKSVKDATKAVQDDTAAAAAAKPVVDALTTAQQKDQATAIARANAHIDALKSIDKEINGVISLTAAYKAASDDLNQTDTSTNKAADQARTDRQKAAKDSLTKEIKAESDAADEKSKIRLTALKDQQDAENTAFDIANRDYGRARDERRRLEDDGYAASARAQTKALDDAQVAEKAGLDKILQVERDAFDDRMTELKHETDKQVTAEDAAWATRKSDLEFTIATTFGATRRAAIDALAAETTAHDDRNNAIKDAGAKQVRAEGETFSASEQAQKDSLKTKQDAEKQALTDGLADFKSALDEKRRLEDQSWTDLTALDKTKMDERHDAQTTSLQKEIDLAKEHMTQLQDVRVKGLEKIQQDENDAATARVAASNAKHPVTMAALQSQINDQLNQRKKMNTDLQAIADKGGADVNSTTLAKLAELGPEAVAVVAASGPEAIQALVKSINDGVSTIDTKAIGDKFNPLGTAAAQGFTDAFSTRFQYFLANPPAGFTGGLLGPAWAALQAANSTVPVPHADGGIYRFADGGEYHTAQIAPAGSWRVWAEPETGGEAYIPLAQSKRGRSTSILAQVAEQFGMGLIHMAGGGVIGGSGNGSMMVSMPIHVEARVAAGVDMDHASRVIAEKVQAGVQMALDQLGRQVQTRSWRN